MDTAINDISVEKRRELGYQRILARRTLETAVDSYLKQKHGADEGFPSAPRSYDISEEDIEPLYSVVTEALASIASPALREVSKSGSDPKAILSLVCEAAGLTLERLKDEWLDQDYQGIALDTPSYRHLLAHVHAALLKIEDFVENYKKPKSVEDEHSPLILPGRSEVKRPLREEPEKETPLVLTARNLAEAETIAQGKQVPERGRLTIVGGTDNQYAPAQVETTVPEEKDTGSDGSRPQAEESSGNSSSESPASPESGFRFIDRRGKY